MEVEWSIPPIEEHMPFPAGEIGAAWRAEMKKVIETETNAIVDDIRGATKSRKGKVKEAYYVEPFDQGVEFGVVVGTRWWPYWLYQEKGTKPGYFPDIRPTSRFYHYAVITGHDPYAMAQYVEREGTRGNFTFTWMWSRASGLIRSRIWAANQRFLRENIP